jgi:transposase InsO family protein
LGKIDLEWAFDLICKEYNIEHRLTKPRHPRTNGMVEKSNDTIKSNTVWIHKYNTKEDMENDILQFMMFYNLFRRHGWIVREKKGKTPYDALLYYYKSMPEIFKEKPEKFRKKMYEFARKKSLQVHRHWNK